MRELRLQAVLAVVLVVGGTFVPSALQARMPDDPPRSVTARWSIMRELKGKQTKFDVFLRATVDQEEEGLEITVSRRKLVKDTVIDLTESHTYLTYLAEGSVVISEDLKTGSIDTTDQMQGWGAVRLDFNKTGPSVEGECETVQKRPGVLSKPSGGKFNIKTGNTVLGSIKEMPSAATARSGGCALLQRTGAECPPDSESAAVASYPPNVKIEANASHVIGASKAKIDLTYGKDVTPARTLILRVKGKVPGSSLDVNDVDLVPATLSFGPEVPFLSGGVEAINAQSQTTSGPYACGSGDGQWTSTYRFAAIDGAISMKWSGRPALALDETQQEAGISLQRTDFVACLAARGCVSK